MKNRSNNHQQNYINADGGVRTSSYMSLLFSNSYITAIVNISSLLK